MTLYLDRRVKWAMVMSDIMFAHAQLWLAGNLRKARCSVRARGE